MWFMQYNQVKTLLKLKITNFKASKHNSPTHMHRTY